MNNILEAVKRVLDKDIEEVLASSLSLELLKVYSILYLYGKQPSSCSRCMKKMYYELKKNGIMKANKMESIKKRTCIPFWKGVKYVPTIAKHISDQYIDDDEAIKYLKEGHLKETDFTKLPDGYKNKEEKKTDTQKTKNTRTAKKTETNK